MLSDILYGLLNLIAVILCGLWGIATLIAFCVIGSWFLYLSNVSPEESLPFLLGFALFLIYLLVGWGLTRVILGDDNASPSWIRIALFMLLLLLPICIAFIVKVAPGFENMNILP